LAQHQKANLEKCFNNLYGYAPKTKWTMRNPKAARSFGKDARQCGPFLCFYAEAVVKNWNVDEMPPIAEFRSHILATLFGKCSLEKTRKKKCHLCIHDDTMQLDICAFCRHYAHSACLEAKVIKGKTYLVCKTD